MSPVGLHPLDSRGARPAPSPEPGEGSHLHPLAELRTWLHGTAEKLRATRQFHPLARVSVAQDIARDAIDFSNRLAAAGHRAECYDREAEKLLTAILADGRVTPDEIPLLQQTLRLIARSAEADHDLAEQAAVPAPYLKP